MTIPELQEKVNKAQERVEKIKKLIEKYKVQKEKKITILNKILEENGITDTYETLKDKSGYPHLYSEQSFHNDYYWACCDVRDKENGIIDNTKKLAEAEKVLKNWQEKLRLEQVKLQYIQDNVPQVIKDFLLDWKKKVFNYYKDLQASYKEDRIQYYADLNRAYYDDIINNPEIIQNDRRRAQFEEHSEYDPDFNYEHLLWYNERPRCNKALITIERFDSKYDGFFRSYKSRSFDDDWLDKVLTEEMNDKLIDLMTRVSKVTGEIIDAQYLYIANDGNLNGYVIGKDGNATVETIGAGGYNIQRRHWRVLIKPKK